MEVRIISEQEVRDIVLSILSEEMNSELWCEDGSIRMDIKRLKPSDGINSSAIDMLLERVKVLENEMIDKDLRISKLENSIEDIRNGMHGLKEINTTLKKLEEEIIEKL